MPLTLANPRAYRPPFGTPPNWNHPLMRGLRGWYPLNEGYGTTAHDISGHQFHGSFVNATVSDWVYEPVVGRALNFGGTNEYIDIQYEPIGAGDFTLSMWLRWDDYTTESTPKMFCIADREDTGNSREYLFSFEGREAQTPDDCIESNLDRFSNENQEIQSPNNSIQDNNWHHAAATIRSGDVHKLYLDGVEVASAAVTGDLGDITSSRYVTIGCEWHNGIFASFFDGKITDVRLWQRALSAHEIMSLYVDPWAAYQQFEFQVPKEGIPSLLGVNGGLVGGGLISGGLAR